MQIMKKKVNAPTLLCEKGKAALSLALSSRTSSLRQEHLQKQMQNMPGFGGGGGGGGGGGNGSATYSAGIVGSGYNPNPSKAPDPVDPYIIVTQVVIGSEYYVDNQLVHDCRDHMSRKDPRKISEKMHSEMDALERLLKDVNTT